MGSSDLELDARGIVMVNGIWMLVAAANHCQMRLDRKLNVGKVVNCTFGNELIKEKKRIYGDLL